MTPKSSPLRASLVGFVSLLLGGLFWRAEVQPALGRLQSLPHLIGQTVPCEFGGRPRDVLITGTDALPAGLLVVRFTLHCQDAPQGLPYERIGHLTLQRVLLGWELVSQGTTQAPGIPRPDALVQLYAALGRSREHRYLIVYGQALRADVAELVWRFPAGEIRSVPVVAGRFSLLRLSDEFPCVVRILDAQRHVLQERDLELCS